MRMSKKDFVSLADVIRRNFKLVKPIEYEYDNNITQEVSALANWLEANNPHFDRQKWLDYIHLQR